MMHGHGKSHSPIVLTKLPNKAACAAAEAVEERGLAKGKMLERNMPGHRAGNTCPARLSGYVRQPEVKGVSIVIILILSDAPWRYYPRQEPDAVMLHVRIR